MIRRRLWGRVVRTLALTVLMAAPVLGADTRCPGDCNGDGRVTIAEVITVINMNLGLIAPSTCPNGTRQPGQIDNVDAVCALRTALYSMCGNCPP